MFPTAAEHARRALSEMLSLDNGEPIEGKDSTLRTRTLANYLSNQSWIPGNAWAAQATQGLGRAYRLGRRVENLCLTEVVELLGREKTERGYSLGARRHCGKASDRTADQQWRRPRESLTDPLRNMRLAGIAQQEHDWMRLRRRRSWQ